MMLEAERGHYDNGWKHYGTWTGLDKGKSMGVNQDILISEDSFASIVDVLKKANPSLPDFSS